MLNLSIRLRVLISFAINISMALAVTYITLYYTRSVHLETLALDKASDQVLSQIYRLHLAFTEQEENIRHFLLSGNTDYLEQYRNSQQIFDHALKEISASVGSSGYAPASRRLTTELPSDLEKLANKQTQFSHLVKRYLNLLDLGFPKSAIFLWEEKSVELHDSTTHLIKSLQLKLIESVSNKQLAAQNYEDKAFTTAIVAAGIMLTFSSIIGFKVCKLLLAPLNSLKEVTEQIGQGNLSIRLTDAGNHEVNELYHSVNRMVEDLNQQFGSTRKAAAHQARQAIAQDLHDDVAQTLFSANLIAQGLEKVLSRNNEGRQEVTQKQLSTLSQLTQNALAEMRVLLRDSLDSHDSKEDLTTSLPQFISAFSTQNSLKVIHQIDAIGPLPDQVANTIFRVAQESLNNIKKHADASEVMVSLHRQINHIVLKIQDNGKGFCVNKKQKGHFGLTIMRQRVAEIGGELIIKSEISKGTQISLKWNKGAAV